MAIHLRHQRALLCLGFVGLLGIGWAEDEGRTALSQTAKEECHTLKHGTVPAVLDRTLLSGKNRENRLLKGDLLWQKNSSGASEGLFSGSWSAEETPFPKGTISWRFPKGREMRTIELEFGDGLPSVFSYATHLITLATGDCAAQAYYTIHLRPEWLSRIEKAKSLTIRVTGIAEAMDQDRDAEESVRSIQNGKR